jgi:3-isopropylmalate dehydrogenase
MTKVYNIAVIPGDGVGAEVIAQGVKTLNTVAQVFGFKFEFTEYPFGVEHYLKTGELIPDKAFEEIKQQDAVYLGAIGDPRVEPGILEFGIVGRLRFDLDLYVNLRPIKCYSDHLCPLKFKKAEDIDILVVRENTEDCYRGKTTFHDKGTSDEVAIQEMYYTRKGTERIIKYAFEKARERPRKKLTLVDKRNAILAHDIYRRVFDEYAKQYPDVKTEYAYVDATCMWFLRNPENFDTIITTNMFGDILTDLGAALQGGLGIAAGGNIHPGKHAMFEPIHGSAPKYKGQNKANPLATICAGGMMLEFLGEKEAAKTLENAVINTVKRLPSLGTDSGFKTDEIGCMVINQLKSL